jgi:HlyD family secretion protein
MIRRIGQLLLPLFAVALLAFAVLHAIWSQRREPDTPPPVPPPLTPFGYTVAGAGLVEPSTEASGTGNIAIGSQLAGAVFKVHVAIGQEVKVDDLLFELDPRLTEADLKVRLANVVVAQAQVEVAEANWRLNEDQYERARRLRNQGAMAQQDYVAAEQAFQSARAQLVLAKANVGQARAQVEQDKTTLALLKVRAPVGGTVLQVNVRPGEYVSTQGAQNLILMGRLRPLHVRVNVDQEDLPRLVLNAPAKTKLRGDARQEEIPLTFVRLEPYVVPKTSLTGANTERVDTRVVQVIYAINPDHRLVKQKKILVGQLVDVFIEARPVGPGADGTSASGAGR